MSPTEFSNYIKQRQQLQQHNNHYHHQQQPQQQQQTNHHQNMFGAIGSVSPARSISPNPMTLQMTNDSSMHQNPFVFSSNGFNGLNMYQSFGSPRNHLFDGLTNGGSGNYNQFNGNNNDPLLFTPGKCSSFMDQQSNFCKIPSTQQQQQNSQSTLPTTSPQVPNNITNGSSATNVVGAVVGSSNASNQQQQSENKLLDGMNSFYNNNANSSYQHHLLVAN